MRQNVIKKALFSALAVVGLCVLASCDTKAPTGSASGTVPTSSPIEIVTGSTSTTNTLKLEFNKKTKLQNEGKDVNIAKNIISNTIEKFSVPEVKLMADTEITLSTEITDLVNQLQFPENFKVEEYDPVEEDFAITQMSNAFGLLTSLSICGKDDFELKDIKLEYAEFNQENHRTSHMDLIDDDTIYLDNMVLSCKDSTKIFAYGSAHSNTVLSYMLFNDGIRYSYNQEKKKIVGEEIVSVKWEDDYDTLKQIFDIINSDYNFLEYYANNQFNKPRDFVETNIINVNEYINDIDEYFLPENIAELFRESNRFISENEYDDKENMLIDMYAGLDPKSEFSYINIEKAHSLRKFIELPNGPEVLEGNLFGVSSLYDEEFMQKYKYYTGIYMGDSIKTIRKTIVFDHITHFFYDGTNSKIIEKVLNDNPNCKIYINDETFYNAMKENYPEAHIEYRFSNYYGVYTSYIEGIKYFAE